MSNILFVCLGNICRSPLAEGFFQYHCQQHKLERRFSVDSSGTGGWHIGKAPDSRAIKVAGEMGIDISKLTARQVNSKDFQHYDWIIAMDRHNLVDLEDMAKNTNSHARIELLSRLINTSAFVDVPDPWYGDYADFQQVAGLLDQACATLLNVVLRNA